MEVKKKQSKCATNKMLIYRQNTSFHLYGTHLYIDLQNKSPFWQIVFCTFLSIKNPLVLNKYEIQHKKFHLHSHTIKSIFPECNMLAYIT